MPLQSIDLIADYHAHIYFDNAEQRHVAQALRDEIAQRFDVFVSRLVDKPIGPHPVPMFEIAFDPSMFATIVPWLVSFQQIDGVEYIDSETAEGPLPFKRDRTYTRAAISFDHIAPDTSTLPSLPSINTDGALMEP